MPEKKKDKEKTGSRETGKSSQVTPSSVQIPMTNGDGTCVVCGKPMYDDEEHDCIALHIEVLAHSEANRVLKIFGKQAFNICFVCFLRVLGVKEIKKEKPTRYTSHPGVFETPR